METIECEPELAMSYCVLVALLAIYIIQLGVYISNSGTS